jgi:hypothetical protein
MKNIGSPGTNRVNAALGYLTELYFTILKEDDKLLC